MKHLLQQALHKNEKNKYHRLQISYVTIISYHKQFMLNRSKTAFLIHSTI